MKPLFGIQKHTRTPLDQQTMDEEAAASAMPVGEEQENKENENANDEPKTDAAMEEEASQSAAVEEPVEKNKPEKKVRRRKKGLYQAIRKQIEFYFSDANLAKDRFMQKITSNTDGNGNIIFDG